MAREFGVRSYKPEEIYYSMALLRKGGKNQPNSIMEHTLYANIFLEAYGNPSTAEELSLELGVALPYMENELEYLVRETFLIAQDGKYQTSFPIISRTAQEKLHCAKRSAAPEITKAIMDFVNRLNGTLGEGYYGEYQDSESAKWTLLMLAHQYFSHRYIEVKSPHTQAFTQRPDDGQWDIVGYQHCPVTDPAFVGNHVQRGKGYFLQQFGFTPTRSLSAEDARVLYDAVMGQINEVDALLAAELAEAGYLRRAGEIYEPAIMVMKPAEIRYAVESLDAETRSALTALADRVKEALEKLHRSITEILRSDLPKIFSRDDYLCGIAVDACCCIRGFLLEEAVGQGLLLPADQVSPAVGVYMDLL